RKIGGAVGRGRNSQEQVGLPADAGMDAVRVNLSHGTQEEHARTAGFTRAVQTELGRPLALIADLQGPKLRIGSLDEPRALETGEEVVVAGEDAARGGDLPVAPSGIRDVLPPGDRGLIDHGPRKLVVEAGPER